MKDTATFTSLVNRERDVPAARPGCQAFRCRPREEGGPERDEVAKARLFSRILLAEQEIENGEVDEYDVFASKLREEYGL